MNFNTDFHVHTIYSDGLMRPVDIVKKYKEEEYSVVAITDHDTVAGVNEALIAADALEMNVVPGIELSCTAKLDDGVLEDVHILGYYIDINNKALLETSEKLLGYRRERNQEVVSRLKEMGIDLDLAELQKSPGNDFVGKADFVRVFEERNYDIESPWEFLSSVPKKCIDVQEAIDVIKGAGGIPVLAHPLKIRDLRPEEDGFYERLDTVLRALKKMGLKGLECYHPSADNEASLKLVSFASKYHLHITNGSDFHGKY